MMARFLSPDLARFLSPDPLLDAQARQNKLCMACPECRAPGSVRTRKGETRIGDKVYECEQCPCGVDILINALTGKIRNVSRRDVASVRESVGGARHGSESVAVVMRGEIHDADVNSPPILKEIAR